MEEIVGTVTRTTQPKRGGLYGVEDVVLVFSTERLFVLSGSVTKGIFVSGLFGMAGSIWAIKKLKDEDKIGKADIVEIEKQSKRTILLSSIMEIKVEKASLGLATKISVNCPTETLVFKTLEEYSKVKNLVAKLK